MHDAKTHLSRILDDVANRHESVIIAKAGTPVARLVPILPERTHRVFGFLKGRIRIAEDFNAPLPDDVMQSFEGDQ